MDDCIMFTASTDAETPKKVLDALSSHGVAGCWRDDVLPCRVYLRHCVLASQNRGPDCHENFLDHTWLADRTTTIRQHLAANPGIMEELPPESLKERYSG